MPKLEYLARDMSPLKQAIMAVMAWSARAWDLPGELSGSGCMQRSAGRGLVTLLQPGRGHVAGHGQGQAQRRRWAWAPKSRQRV